MNQELLKFLLTETIERLEKLTKKNVELIDPSYVTLPEVYTSKEVLELDGLLVSEFSFENKTCVIVITTKFEAFVLQLHDTPNSLLGKLVWSALTDVFITSMKSSDTCDTKSNRTDDAFEEIIHGVMIENSKVSKIDELYQDLQERAPYEEKSERITNIINSSRSVSEALRKLT